MWSYFLFRIVHQEVPRFILIHAAVLLWIIGWKFPFLYNFVEVYKKEIFTHFFTKFSPIFFHDSRFYSSFHSTFHWDVFCCNHYWIVDWQFPCLSCLVIDIGFDISPTLVTWLPPPATDRSADQQTAQIAESRRPTESGGHIHGAENQGGGFQSRKDGE